MGILQFLFFFFPRLIVLTVFFSQDSRVCVGGGVCVCVAASSRLGKDLDSIEYPLNPPRDTQIQHIFARPRVRFLQPARCGFECQNG
jgi:hypothetical protein